MTSDEIRAFCERFAGLWEREDIPGLAACYSDDCEVISPLFRTLKGRTEVEGSFRDLFKALAIQTVHIDDIIVDRDGERAALLWTTQSTHRGEIFGMPGTGRRIENEVALILTFRGDRIRHDRRIYDFTRMLMQLGVLRAKTA
jgi:ketosteroid isomerase-like protein